VLEPVHRTRSSQLNVIRAVGDGFRMPGAFLVSSGRVVHTYRHATAADRPDYVELAGACAVDGLEHAA